jgi:hypothetical protein
MAAKKKAVKNKEVSEEIVEGNSEIVQVEEPPRIPVTEKDIAMDFAMKVQKKFDRIVKASVLFGSQASAKNSSEEGSDIDIILIVDDAAVNWDLELVSWYREELAKLVSSQNYGENLHINTVRLTTWWNDMLHGDPVVINILRYGEALIDYGGFFNPLKALLLEGKIKSTPEAVHAALSRAPGHLARSKMSVLGAIEGAYWTMVDSAQAALMTAGKMPPSPEQIPEMLKAAFVDTNLLKINYVKGFGELLSVHKAIGHGHINNIKGAEVDQWQELAENFMKEMTRLIGIMLEGKK